jgi:DNA-binding XRE family transcriptional regulator
MLVRRTSVQVEEIVLGLKARLEVTQREISQLIGVSRESANK